MAANSITGEVSFAAAGIYRLYCVRVYSCFGFYSLFHIFRLFARDENDLDLGIYIARRYCFGFWGRREYGSWVDVEVGGDV